MLALGWIVEDCCCRYSLTAKCRRHQPSLHLSSDVSPPYTQYILWVVSKLVCCMEARADWMLFPKGVGCCLSSSTFDTQHPPSILHTYLDRDPPQTNLYLPIEHHTLLPASSLVF